MSRRHAQSSERDTGKPPGDGLALTEIGECTWSYCRAPLFAELLMPGAPRLCINCGPPFVERMERFQEDLHNLFVRSGGRLPPDYERFLGL